MFGSVCAVVVQSLEDILDGRCTTNQTILGQHGRDESWHDGQAPDVVCYVRSSEEVAKVVSLCADSRIPVIAFGTGTGMEGQVTAPFGGVCIDLSEMNQVLRVSPEDRDCTVQPGVTRKQLNESLRHSGLFFPIDPGADASIGGMVATRASGTNAVRYGTMRDAVLCLTVVLADGRIISTGTRAPKSSAGYDLSRLFVGSEGTLGIVTEVTLRLHPQPEYVTSARVQFKSVACCVDATIAAIQSAIPLARVELLDSKALAAVNNYSNTSYPELPTLFVEFHGTEQSSNEQLQRFKEICADHESHEFSSSSADEERNKMWEARHTAAYAAKASRAGSRVIPTDVCVPISTLATCIEQAQRCADEIPHIPTILVGHVGDGNFHLAFIIDPKSETEMNEVKSVNEEIVACALQLGGTCTGEHGIGIGKQQAMIDEIGQGGVDAMKAVKEALDPQGILNPGKLFLSEVKKA